MGIGAKPYDILVCESVAGEAGEGSGNSDYRAGYERGNLLDVRPVRFWEVREGELTIRLPLY